MRSIVLSAALALLAGCGSTPAHPPAELTEIQPTATLKILWQGSVGSAEKNSFFPQAFGNVIYAVGADGSVTGFDKASGRPTVSIDAGERVSGGVGVGGGLVLLGTPKGRGARVRTRGQASCGRRSSPAKCWRHRKRRKASSWCVPVMAGFTGWTSRPASGKWMYQRATPALTVRTYAGVVVRRGGVFAGFPGGRLVALALANGNVGWEAVVALPRGTTELERVADVTSLPVDRRAAGVRRRVPGTGGLLRCVSRDPVVGARRVQRCGDRRRTRATFTSPTTRTPCMALDKTSGASIWRQDKLAGRNVSAPLALGRHVVVGRP